jgi:hypothetical protein
MIQSRKGCFLLGHVCFIMNACVQAKQMTAHTLNTAGALEGLPGPTPCFLSWVSMPMFDTVLPLPFPFPPLLPPGRPESVAAVREEVRDALALWGAWRQHDLREAAGEAQVAPGV